MGKPQVELTAVFRSRYIGSEGIIAPVLFSAEADMLTTAYKQIHTHTLARAHTHTKHTHKHTHTHTHTHTYTCSAPRQIC